MNNMRCLIIEDDQIKLEKIIDYIISIGCIEPVVRNSFQSGISEILENKYEIIILDMSLPLYDTSKGGDMSRPKYFGGRDILKEMKRYKCKSYVVVMTQYHHFDGQMNLKELDTELITNYMENYKGYIFYSNEDEDWKNELKNHLEVVRNANIDC